MGVKARMVQKMRMRTTLKMRRRKEPVKSCVGFRLSHCTQDRSARWQDGKCENKNMSLCMFMSYIWWDTDMIWAPDRR